MDKPPSESDVTPDVSSDVDLQPNKFVRRPGNESEPTPTPQFRWLSRVLTPTYRLLSLILDRNNRLESWLNQAHFTMAVEAYLARTARLVVVGWALAFLGLLCIGVVLARRGVIRLGESMTAVAGGLLVAAVVGATVLAALLAATRYFYPVWRADQRRRQINRSLPQAVTLMYALSMGDVRPAAIFGQLGEAKDVYGTVSEEFQAIAIDASRLNTDIITAVEDAKKRTPSDELAAFLWSFQTALKASSDVQTFFKQASHEQLKRARHRQEAYIETVATWAEVYFTTVFAGSIFLLVTLTILSFTGAAVLRAVSLVVYLLLPALILTGAILIGRVDQPFSANSTLRLSDIPNWLRAPDETGLYGEYRRYKRRKALREELVRAPLYLKRQPVLTLILTVPVALVVAGLGWLTDPGGVTPTAKAPIQASITLLIVPALVPSVGLMAAYELNRHQYAGFHRRFPGVLRLIASASESGIRFVDALELATERQSGQLNKHFERLISDIRLTNNVTGALYRLADAMLLTQVDRIVYTVVNTITTTPNYGAVFDIMATESEARRQRTIDRQQALQPYAFLLIIGILVFLFMTIVFDQVFFPLVSGVSGDLPAGISKAPTETLSALSVALFHSMVILTVGNSLLVGRLIEGSVLGGLKYANALLVIVTLTYTLI